MTKQVQNQFLSASHDEQTTYRNYYRVIYLISSREETKGSKIVKQSLRSEQHVTVFKTQSVNR